MSAAAPPALLVVTWRFPAVSETYVVDHLRGMADRGWAVSMCCVELDAPLLAERPDLSDRLDSVVELGRDVAAPPAGRRLRRLSRERAWRGVHSRVTRHAATMAGPLRDVVDELRPDLVHAHFGPNAAAAALAVGADRPPVVADLHGYDLTEIPQREGWSAYRRLLGDACWVVHSRFAAGLVRSGAGLEPVLVPVEPALDLPADGRPDRWPTPLRLLFVGRLVPEKGAELAVEALARLAARRPVLDPKLTVVGDGPTAPDLRDRAHSLGVDGRVTFLGARRHAEVRRIMGRHDMLLVPSQPSPSGWIEAFGLAAAEGHRSGMGVIASRSGGLPEAVGPLGSVVDTPDPAAWAAAVEELLANTTPAALAATAAQAAPRPDHTTIMYDRLSRDLLTS